ncbi:MAG TPA: hypothetical protein VNR67_01890, partial [Solirubrobacterales bacterium]|nr:hypothetical protein [Solirubrobacterales bacterium]
EGAPALDLPPCMIGDSGVVIEAREVALHLGDEAPPPGRPAGWRGLALGKVGLHLPGDLGASLGDLSLSEATIGQGGFTGKVEDAWNPPRKVSLGGFDFELLSASIGFAQNAIVSSEVRGRFNLPFFDLPVGVRLGFNLDGSVAVELDVGGGLLNLEKPGLLKLTIDSLALDLGDPGPPAVKISGKLRPLVGGVEWPEIAVSDLAIDPEGNVRLAGGWIDLPSQYALDFHGFKLDVVRLGFGRSDDGGRWIGFSGGLKLVEGLPAGASVEGLRVSWWPDQPGRAPAVTLNGVGVELEVPGAFRFKGEVSYRELVEDGRPVHRFDGDITLELLALELELDAQLVIGSAQGANGTYTFFAIYLGVELPVGIPLWTTGVGLYGVAGLLALSMEPNKKPEEQWYAIDPARSWYHRPKAGATDLKTKWKNREGSMALGAGVTLGTVADNGFSVNGKMLLAIVLPGPIVLIEGKANILRERSKLDDEPIFRALAVLDGREGTMLLGLDASYKFGDGGELIEIHGGGEAFFDFDDPLAWHLYLGRNEPREQRIRAQVFKLFEANAYFMLDARSLATGAWVGYDARYRFGPLTVSFSAWMEGDAKISYKPAHYSTSMRLHGGIGLKVFGFGLELYADARIAAEVFDPFHLLAGVEVGIELPWPLPDISAHVTLEWGPEKDPPPLPLPLKEVAIGHPKTTATWPLPRGSLLLPEVDRDRDGFLDPAGVPAPP